MRTITHITAARVFALIGAYASLVGCSGGVDDVRMRVLNAHDGAPAWGAHVRAVALDAGLVPLPLDDRTIPELLALADTRSGGFADSRGDVRLRLTPGRAHLVEVEPPPFDDAADAHPGEWWLLDEDASIVVRIDRDRLGGDPPQRFDVRINP